MATNAHAAPGPPEGRPGALLMVETELRETESYLLDVVTSDFPFVSVLAQHLVRAGGKRLRVALAFLAAGYGDRAGASHADVRKLAAAIELTHLATLHHDDVMDEAQMRHGVAAVHSNWSNTLAILSGDYLFAKSSQLAAEVGGEAPIVLAKTIAALCEGQIKEVESLGRLDRSPDDYLYVIERKTARLMSASAYLGARVAGAGVPVAEALERYATSLGIAFQIRDDLLDFLADTEQTGKPAGTDVKGGVYTLPVLHAAEQGVDLKAALLDGDLQTVIQRLHDAGSFSYARAEAERYADQARQELAGLADVPERRSLTGLLDYIVESMPVSSAA